MNKYEYKNKEDDNSKFSFGIKNVNAESLGLRLIKAAI